MPDRTTRVVSLRFLFVCAVRCVCVYLIQHNFQCLYLLFLLPGMCTYRCTWRTVSARDLGSLGEHPARIGSARLHIEMVARASASWPLVKPHKHSSAFWPSFSVSVCACFFLVPLAQSIDGNYSENSILWNMFFFRYVLFFSVLLQNHS